MKSFIFLINLLVGTLCFAHPNDKKVLLVIGYADDAHITSVSRLVSHPHFNGIGMVSEASVNQLLTQLKFTKNEFGQMVNKDLGTEFTILNANVTCPNEVTGKTNIRISACYQQIRRSNEIRNYLNLNLKKFDSLIYVGHSRNGLGMGIGPFTPEFTYQIKIFNEVEKGQLKRILFSSCESNKYYGKYFSNIGIEFIGTGNSIQWPSESMPMVLAEIINIINKSNYLAKNRSIMIQKK